MKKAYPRLEEAFFKYKLIEGAVSPTKESYKRLSHYRYYNIGKQEKRKEREKERKRKQSAGNRKGALFFCFQRKMMCHG